MTERVVDYYDEFDEWSRLETPSGRLEYERTLSYVSARLPPSSDVLDIGGGPGRYAIALAQAGHRVSLVDPSNVQIAAARSRAADSGVLDRLSVIATGDIRDLTRFKSRSFDAVVALGPFYHLIEAAARLAAAQELFRVLRTAGQAFVAFIPRLSGLAGLIQRGANDPEQVTPEVLSRVARSGLFINSTDRGFQDGYYPNIPDIERLFTDVGFAQEDLFSIRGLAFGYESDLQTIGESSPDSARAIERLLEAHCREPSVIAHGGHALLYLRKSTTVNGRTQR